ncbi:MAG: hypothetical protein LBM63_00570 [Rikenellaceae bacterium]|nr:hypothetical protein [Rikenellaceae bacterium]
MRGKKHTTVSAIVVVLLSLVLVCSCSVARKMKKPQIEGEHPDADSLFIPLHPPVVLPYTWREAMTK